MMDLLNDETDEEIELVEISDAEGNRAEMRRLATVEYSGKLYHILGAVQEDETDDFSDDGLVLCRVRTARRMARTNTSSRRTSAKSSRLSAGM